MHELKILLTIVNTGLHIILYYGIHNYIRMSMSGQTENGRFRPGHRWAVNHVANIGRLAQ